MLSGNRLINLKCKLSFSLILDDSTIFPQKNYLNIVYPAKSSVSATMNKTEIDGKRNRHNYRAMDITQM